MRRVVLVLAAMTVLRCDDCGPDPKPKPQDTARTGAVHVYWDFVRRAPAQQGGTVTYDATFVGVTDGSCTESGVETITVDVDGAQKANVPCVYGGVQGATVGDLFAGARAFRVRGWRNGLAHYDQGFSLVVTATPAAPAAYYLDVAAVQASAELRAALSYGTNTYYETCAAASNPTVECQLYDAAGTLVATASSPCADPASPSFPVLVGNLDLDRYRVRMRSTSGAFDSCPSAEITWVEFDHLAPQVGVEALVVTLTTPAACPP